MRVCWPPSRRLGWDVALTGLQLCARGAGGKAEPPCGPLWKWVSEECFFAQGLGSAQSGWVPEEEPLPQTFGETEAGGLCSAGGSELKPKAGHLEGQREPAGVGSGDSGPRRVWGRAGPAHRSALSGQVRDAAQIL